MADLYSYFLFNPLGSSRIAPSPSLSAPHFSMSQPGDGLSPRDAFPWRAPKSLGYHLWVLEVSTTQK